MHISVIIPTYNRKPILEKCLIALENQKYSALINDYEVVVVDDGSTDGTPAWIKENKNIFKHVTLIEQEHQGPGQGRNNGVLHSKGDVIVFIDSDLVVTDSFLESHALSLSRFWRVNPNRNCFTYGAVVNTSNFDNPISEPHKLSDLSWAYFATGNVAIDKKVLLSAGLFDPAFVLYGWEDLELGERLRSLGVRLIKCPNAVGYHWHPSLKLSQIPDLIRVEKERAKMALVFYRKHPTLRVRFIIQYTFLHRVLWETLTIGGLFNVSRIKPLLYIFIKYGYPALAMEILRIPLNLIGVRAIYREARKLGLR
ncbi:MULTISPECIES: glycosyltransferase family 2 protein [Prochlorococcus]|uniref:glycosyltransferase family 2 protein n=1 Tax=Prochlorococcus TaxID=1218 RepID=UPI000533A1AF|nr:MULTISPECIES: glycosyltransferase [Prochlorococcus]KGG12333.1 Glycosyl transferase [Prochlorococcus sp. MIT 0601]